jgi:hypothetical protein
MEKTVDIILQSPEILERFANGISYAGDKIAGGVRFVGEKIGDGARYVGDKVSSTARWVSEKFGGGGSPGGPNWGKGFRNFTQLKNYLGSPGKGNEWHHIVEQSQIKASRAGFAPEMIQNVSNVVNVSKDLHRQISAYYSRIDPALSRIMTVRDYVSSMSFEQQYEFGLSVLRRFEEMAK